MGRNLRERPRVVIAQLLGLVVVFVIGLLVGGALDSDPAPKTPVAVQDRLSKLEREVKQNRGASEDLKKSQATEKRLRAQVAARGKRLRAAAARERRLRAALRRARR